MKTNFFKQRILLALVSSAIVMTPAFSVADDHNGKDHKKQEQKQKHLDQKKASLAKQKIVAPKNQKNKWQKEHARVHQTSQNKTGKWVQTNRNNNWLSASAESKRRQKTKNEWRNIAIASGALAVFGALKHDNTLMFVGAAGALYSLDRYEKDRKSQSKTDRLRATYFSKRSFVRDGRQYKRKTVSKNGHKYYQFVRA